MYRVLPVSRRFVLAAPLQARTLDRPGESTPVTGDQDPYPPHVYPTETMKNDDMSATQRSTEKV